MTAEEITEVETVEVTTEAETEEVTLEVETVVVAATEKCWKFWCSDRVAEEIEITKGKN